MPVDPHPDERGNVAALKTPTGYTDGRYLAKGERPADGEVRLMAHFATCGAPDKPGRPRPRPPDPPPALFDLDDTSSDPPPF